MTNPKKKKHRIDQMRVILILIHDHLQRINEADQRPAEEKSENRATSELEINKS